jgi:uncharacterized protein YjbI with pentapeptide repeats
VAQEQSPAGQEQQPAQPTKKPRTLLWVGIIATLALVLGLVAVIAYGYAARPGWVGVSNKRVWDYLELLIVPTVLAIGVAWLNWMQSKRAAREAEDAQLERDRNESNRRRRELYIASLRAQDEALQAYLGHMSELLMDDSLYKRLRDATDSAGHNLRGHNLRVLARARTLTVLGQLEDGLRKGSVLQFLYEADLITWVPQNATTGAPAQLERLPQSTDRDFIGVIDLSGADLSHAVLTNAFLHEVALGSRPNAPGVNLRGAQLYGAYLSHSLFNKANLSYATLKCAHLAYSDLTEVTATGTNFSGADLIGATLTSADLRDANLSDADLRGAHQYIKDKDGSLKYQPVTNEQLERLGPTLRNATMPDGQKYEEWLKSNQE